MNPFDPDLDDTMPDWYSTALAVVMMLNWANVICIVSGLMALTG